MSNNTHLVEKWIYSSLLRDKMLEIILTLLLFVVIAIIVYFLLLRPWILT
jgi:hypothetical protein